MSNYEDDARGSVMAGVDALRSDVSRLVEAISELTKLHVKPIEAHVVDMMNDAKNTVVNAGNAARDQARATSDEFEAGIQRNPLMAVLIAFGVGVVVALVGGTRR